MTFFKSAFYILAVSICALQITGRQIKLSPGCQFGSNYKTGADDVVVGEHHEEYPDLIQLPFHILTSPAAVEFLNKYASDHTHYYGFRTTTPNHGIFCTIDNKNVAGINDMYLTTSRANGSYKTDQGKLDYRPKICGRHSDEGDVCDQDWSKIIYKPLNVYSHITINQDINCARGDWIKYGLFMKRHVYFNIVNGCDFLNW
jgi:hypothetical protein